MLLCVCVTLIVAGCTSNPLIGTWECTGGKVQGMDMELEELAVFTSMMGSDIASRIPTLTFKDDGKCSADAPDQEPYELYYSLNDNNTVSLQHENAAMPDQYSMVYDPENNTITWDVGTAELTYEKT